MISNTMTARVIRRILERPVRLKLYVGSPSEYAMQEATFNGYRSVVLTSRDWSIRSDLATPIAEAAVVNFRFDGGPRQTIRGAYITDDADDAVLWIQAFPDPGFEMARTGDTIPVQPRYALSALGDTSGA